jgi:hypothetical protein
METITSHYVRINITGPGQFEIWLVEEIFNLSEYSRAQIDWAKKCPYNRNGVREKMGWSDSELDKNPSVLLDHFVQQHGDDWFRENLRPKFIRVRSKKLEGVNPDCFLTKVHAHCQKCHECLMAKLGATAG